MNITKISAAIAMSVLLILAAMTTDAAAQPFEIESFTIDAGGGKSSNGSLELHGTIGQPDAGQESTGGSLSMTGGFWPGIQIDDPLILGDVNGDGEVNLLDVAPFVDAITNGIYIEEADLNLDGVVDLLDVQPFVDLLTGG